MPIHHSVHVWTGATFWANQKFINAKTGASAKETSSAVKTVRSNNWKRPPWPKCPILTLIYYVICSDICLSSKCHDIVMGLYDIIPVDVLWAWRLQLLSPSSMLKKLCMSWMAQLMTSQDSCVHFAASRISQQDNFTSGRAFLCIHSEETLEHPRRIWLCQLEVALCKQWIQQIPTTLGNAGTERRVQNWY